MKTLVPTITFTQAGYLYYLLNKIYRETNIAEAILLMEVTMKTFEGKSLYTTLLIEGYLEAYLGLFVETLRVKDHEMLELLSLLAVEEKPGFIEQLTFFLFGPSLSSRDSLESSNKCLPPGLGFSGSTYWKLDKLTKPIMFVIDNMGWQIRYSLLSTPLVPALCLSSRELL